MAQTIAPKKTKPKSIFVNAEGADVFLRKNLVEGDDSYDVEMYVIGRDDDGNPAIIENPKYDGRKDPNGKLKPAPETDGIRFGSNGQALPGRYPVAFKGLGEDIKTVIRQDN